MTYKIYIGSWGSECVAGMIPDNIWKYIEDECEGDADIYKEKLDEGEVPEEFQLASDVGSFYDVESFYNEYGPYCHSTLTVCDEDGYEELMTIDSKDIVSEFKVKSAPNGRPYFIWESVEKGSWYVDIETDDEKFDKDKLKLHIDKLAYDNDNNGIAFIHAVEYDGVVYDVELDSTTGKSYELSFFKDEENDNELFAPMDSLLERIAKNLQKKIEAEGDDTNTEDAEKNILGYISDLDLDDLEKVDSRDNDGLYINPNDTAYYALVKDGKVLLAFE